MISEMTPPMEQIATIRVRPYRSERAPSLGAVKALTMPTKTLMHKVKLATRRCTSGMLHWGLLPPWITGVKTKLGSAADLSAKYRSQMRVMILDLVSHSIESLPMLVDYEMGKTAFDMEEVIQINLGNQ